jgi:hypothetical protein
MSGKVADVAEKTTTGRTRPWWLSALLRGPGDLASLPARVIITLMIAGGAVCTAGSGVIHLYLWGKQYGYRDVPTIGPLFLLQGIAAILLAVLVLVSRRAVALILAGGMLVMSVVALVIAIEVGLFGFKDSWLAPYAWTTFYEEIAGAVLLLVAAAVLIGPALPFSRGGSRLGRPARAGRYARTAAR